MKFLIVSHVIHSKLDDKIYGYGPYIKEMNLWLKYVDEVEIIAPLRGGKPDKIDLSYKHDKLTFTQVPAFNLIGIKNKLKTILVTPWIFTKILIAMQRADHIHLRCPGNMGLLGSIAQIFFPSKVKTAKYAGNWDPNSLQPKTYIWQKKILANPILSKNMKVLVYGDWEGQSKNVIPFFTATYKESQKEDIPQKDLFGEIRLLFVGSLSAGKQPMLALESLKSLRDDGINVRIDMLGEGVERSKLEKYISKYNLEKYASLHGNQNADYVKEMYKKSHFLILVSKSEGWPKVVAEAMFWGCLPISSKVSCVAYMLDYGKRGKVIESNVNDITKEIKYYINNPQIWDESVSQAVKWSRAFTLDRFEKEIGKLLDEKKQ